MKKLIVVAAGTVALMSGAAYAEGCAYGKHLANEASQSQTPVIAAADEAEAERLRKLAALEEQVSAEGILQAPVIHN